MWTWNDKDYIFQQWNDHHWFESFFIVHFILYVFFFILFAMDFWFLFRNLMFCSSHFKNKNQCSKKFTSISIQMHLNQEKKHNDRGWRCCSLLLNIFNSTLSSSFCFICNNFRFDCESTHIFQFCCTWCVQHCNNWFHFIDNYIQRSLSNGIHLMTKLKLMKRCSKAFTVTFCLTMIRIKMIIRKNESCIQSIL